MDQGRIGNFIKDLRKEKGLTQEQLAEQFAVSRRTVSRWETASNMPDLDLLNEDSRKRITSRIEGAGAKGNAEVSGEACECREALPFRRRLQPGNPITRKYISMEIRSIRRTARKTIPAIFRNFRTRLLFASVASASTFSRRTDCGAVPVM